MNRLRSALAAFVVAGLWSGRAQAKQDYLDRAVSFIDKLSPSEYYAGLGAILITVAIVSFKREWSILLTAATTIGGVISLAAASVIWFVVPEAHRWDQTVADRRNHKVDVGEICKTSADCVHEEICVRLRGAMRCYYPCAEGKYCGAPLSCLTARGGEHVCTQ